MRPFGVMKNEETKDEWEVTLMEWSMCEMRDSKGDLWQVILAEVWSDKLGRWEDGTRIRTAVLRSIPEPLLRLGDVVRTKSPAYLLGRPCGATVQ